MYFVIFFMTFLISITGFSESPRFLAKNILIKSLYNDNHPVVGTGSLIEYTENNIHRYFILTAAHVSQGNDLDILVNNIPLTPIDPNSRIFDNQADIDLIEINNSENFLPLATYQKEDQEGNPPYLKIELELGSKNIYFKKTWEALFPYYVGIQFDNQISTRFAIPSFIHYNPLIAHIPNGENYRFKHNLKSSKLDQIEESSYGNTLYTPNSGIIGAGMSGAPLIQSHRISNEIIQSLDGVAIQYLRFGSKSYFASSNVILNLLHKYLKGDRGNVGSYIWKSENGFLYREFCFKILNENCLGPNPTLNAREVVPQKQSAGGGVVGDRGGSLNTQTVLKSFDHELELGINEISAPVKINNQDVLGFKISTKNKDDYLYIDANGSGRDFINQHKNNIDVEMIGSNFNAIDLFLNHFKKQLNGRTKFPLIFSYNKSYNTKVSVFEDRIDIQIPGMRIANPGNKEPLDRDLLIFSLDKFGREIKDGIVAKQFHPVIKVYGSLSHNEYYLDIRQLFFLDLAEIPKVDTFYSTTFNLSKTRASTTDELIRRAYQRGGIINSISSIEPSDNLIIQLYLPSDKNLFEQFFK